jgi:uncharacterized sodium:solute symporter family permease YidK
MKRRERGRVGALLVLILALMMLGLGGIVYAITCCTGTGCPKECCVVGCETGGCAWGSQFGRCFCDGEEITVDCRI